MRRKIIVLFFVTVIISSLGAQSSGAQKAQSRAFLESGPLPCSSMPAIGINALEGFRGIYMFSGKKTDSSVENAMTAVFVYFTRTAVPFFNNWKIVNPFPYKVYVTESETMFIYTHNENWTFFIDFQIKENINLSFMENVIKQMIYFARDGSNFINTSFPAIIEF